MTDRDTTSPNQPALADMPAHLPVFPLAGVLLLPRGQLPLNVFEPRYVTMVNNAMSGDRLIGIIQPASMEEAAQIDDASQKPALQKTGCAGRITSFAETGDGRILITLTGVCRFKCDKELDGILPYRIVQADFKPFADDFRTGLGEDRVDREKLLDTFRAYVAAHNLKVDWEAIKDAPTEALVSGLAMASPYGLSEKQLLLEAPDLEARADALISLTQISLAGNGNDEPTLQ